MKKTIVAFLTCLVLAPLAAPAQNAQRAPSGLYLVTDYPAVTVQPGRASTINLTLHNQGVAPARLALRVEDAPAGWTAQLLGGGQPVGAAMPSTDQSVPLQLRIDVPKDAPPQPHTLTVVAQGGGRELRLPVEVSLAERLPAKLEVQASLPALRGGPRASFDYQLTIRNDSGEDQLVNVAAQAPRGFETSITESYGSQQLSSVPVKAGASKDVKLTVRPPAQAAPERYPLTFTASAGDASASAELSLEITGQPQLRISGRDGLMSLSAEAGRAGSTPVTVSNDGSAPATAVALTASVPSGWTAEFEPRTLERIAPGESAEAQLKLTPSARSLAGDYMATLRAQAGDESASGDFRVTVKTSTLWGIAGAVIIAIAVLVLVGAIARYGRR